MSPQELKKKALAYHCKGKPGKVAIRSTKPCTSGEELSLAYTPGVAQPCLEIKREKELVWKYTARSNTVAVISDGTAVLGLGNIGAEAGLPVMEGKAVLFKHFADIDAIPVCLNRVAGPNGRTDPEKLLAAEHAEHALVLQSVVFAVLARGKAERAWQRGDAQGRDQPVAAKVAVRDDPRVVAERRDRFRAVQVGHDRAGGAARAEERGGIVTKEHARVVAGLGLGRGDAFFFDKFRLLDKPCDGAGVEHGAGGSGVDQEVGFQAVDPALDHDVEAFSFDVQ